MRGTSCTMHQLRTPGHNASRQGNPPHILLSSPEPGCLGSLSLNLGVPRDAGWPPPPHRGGGSRAAQVPPPHTFTPRNPCRPATPTPCKQFPPLSPPLIPRAPSPVDWCWWMLRWAAWARSGSVTLHISPDTWARFPGRGAPHLQRELCIDNLLARIHLIIEMILVDRPCAMGV